MNLKQRILTVVCLILFWVSCMAVPWELTKGTSHFSTIKHAPIFSPPKTGSWEARKPHVSLLYEWGILGISYGGLFLLMKTQRED